MVLLLGDGIRTDDRRGRQDPAAPAPAPTTTTHLATVPALRRRLQVGQEPRGQVRHRLVVLPEQRLCPHRRPRPRRRGVSSHHARRRRGTLAPPHEAQHHLLLEWVARNGLRNRLSGRRAGQTNPNHGSWTRDEDGSFSSQSHNPPTTLRPADRGEHPGKASHSSACERCACTNVHCWRRARLPGSPGSTGAAASSHVAWDRGGGWSLKRVRGNKNGWAKKGRVGVRDVFGMVERVVSRCFDWRAGGHVQARFG